MRKKFLVFFLLISISVFGANNSDDFRYIGLGNKGQEKYLKIDQQTDEYYDVWQKEIYPKKIIRNKRGQKVTVGGNSEMTLLRISCADKTITVLAAYTYDRNGDLVHRYEPKEFEIEKQRVIPGSVGENIFDLVCDSKEAESEAVTE